MEITQPKLLFDAWQKMFRDFWEGNYCPVYGGETMWRDNISAVIIAVILGSGLYPFMPEGAKVRAGKLLQPTFGHYTLMS